MRNNYIFLLLLLLLFTLIRVAAADDLFHVEAILENVKSAMIGERVIFQDKFYFALAGDDAGNELWVTDGTREGTRRFMDINPGPHDSTPRDLTNVNDTMLFFTAFTGGLGYRLFVSDGTADGTVPIQPVESAFSGHELTPAFKDKLIFSNGGDAWISDGTNAGTHLIQDIHPGSSDEARGRYCEYRGEVYFQASAPTIGYPIYELFATDGSTVRLVKDIGGPDKSSFPKNLVVFDDKLFFDANGALWVSEDGTEANTYQLFNVHDPMYFTEYIDGRLYFRSENSVWRTDGTAGGTRLFQLVDTPHHFQLHGNHLSFDSDYGRNGLWLTDGTLPNGTVQLDAMDTAGFGFKSLNGYLFYGAYHHNYEPWVLTNFTAEGARPLLQGGKLQTDPNVFMVFSDNNQDKIKTAFAGIIYTLFVGSNANVLLADGCNL
jgi:ELWxxDGT repeat protein